MRLETLLEEVWRRVELRMSNQGHAMKLDVFFSAGFRAYKGLRGSGCLVGSLGFWFRFQGSGLNLRFGASGLRFRVWV